ncbi:MAG: GTP pyrophosphokinase [Propylenella sp.]
MSELDDLYEKKRSSLESAAERLKSLLLDAVTRIEDRKLVRAEFDAVRPKELSSIKRKARKRGWNPQEALGKCDDLVGGRVVCNNVEDVYRFEELLKESLPIDSGPFERQDYIAKPTGQGYRALHLTFHLNVGQGFVFDFIPCEIQIRSRLQDSWAELAHDDIYKQDDLPPDLRARFKDLSRSLAAADEIASEIRARVQRVTAPPQERPLLDRVSAEGISYIFKEVFGRAPADYAVFEAISLCGDLDVSALDGLPDILKRQDFRDAVREAYSAIVPMPVDAGTVLLAAIHALAEGDAAALRYIEGQAQREFDEIESIARREMQAELPATVEELIEDIEDLRQETDIMLLADALGVKDECAYCHAAIVDPYSFAEAAVQHYELSGDEADEVFERIEQAIMGSGVDVGGPDSSSVCSHCADKLAKDG